MRVLFVYSGNSRTGQNIIVESQGLSLLSRGVEIDFFQVKGKGLWGYLKVIKKLSELFKCPKYDLIHAHYGLSGIAALCSRRKERVIVSFMGDDLVGTNRKNGSIKLWSLGLIKINVLLARYFYDYSIVKSSEMASKLLKGTNFKLIANGVNLVDFHPVLQTAARKKLNIAVDKKVVLFVSDTKREEKNFPLSVSAIETLNDKDILLTAVSNVPVQVLNLHYNSADLLLLTSYHEGSPNVVKEAMACNCPVVSTDVGDVRFLFGEIPGHFIAGYSSEDVSEKIKLALEYRKNNIQTTGRDRILELRLDSDTVAGKIIEVYKKVLN